MTTILGAALRDAGLIPDTTVRTHRPANLDTRMRMLSIMLGEDAETWLAVQERKADDRFLRGNDGYHSATVTFERDGKPVTVTFDLYDEAGLEAAARWAVNRDAPELEYLYGK